MSTELAWAAGFFDGEGNANFSAGKAGRNVVIQVLQAGVATPEVLIRFQEAVGCGKIYGPYDWSNRKSKNILPMWKWCINSKKGVREVYEKLYPYLCEIKRNQIGYAIYRQDNWEDE